ncbi:MAG: PDZ domain-containing protein [Nitrospira sp.]|nr:PDZ domain-containing protein [Nitrospira sp.]
MVDPLVDSRPRLIRVTWVAGALVADVMEDNPASKAGFERGDIITELDGKPVRDPTHLRTLVADSAPGTKVTWSGRSIVRP